MDSQLLSRLIFNVSNLASLTHKAPAMSIALSDKLLELHRNFLANFSDNGNIVQDDNPRLSAVYATEDLFPANITNQIMLLDIEESIQVDKKQISMPMDLNTHNNFGVQAQTTLGNSLPPAFASIPSTGFPDQIIAKGGLLLNPTQLPAKSLNNFDIYNTPTASNLGIQSIANFTVRYMMNKSSEKQTTILPQTLSSSQQPPPVIGIEKNSVRPNDLFKSSIEESSTYPKPLIAAITLNQAGEFHNYQR